MTYVPVNSDGRISLDVLRAAIRTNTRLISIMYANNETGVIQPVEEIGAIARDRGIHFHTDAVQAASKIPSTSKPSAAICSPSPDTRSTPPKASAHSMRRGTLIEPLFFGGTHERQRRAGTENLPAIVAFGCAAELALADFTNGHTAHIAALRDRLERGILELIPDCGVNGGSAPRVPNTTKRWLTA